MNSLNTSSSSEGKEVASPLMSSTGKPSQQPSAGQQVVIEMTGRTEDQHQHNSHSVNKKGIGCRENGGNGDGLLKIYSVSNRSSNLVQDLELLHPSSLSFGWSRIRHSSLATRSFNPSPSCFRRINIGQQQAQAQAAANSRSKSTIQQQQAQESNYNKDWCQHYYRFDLKRNCSGNYQNGLYQQYQKNDFSHRLEPVISFADYCRGWDEYFCDDNYRFGQRDSRNCPGSNARRPHENFHYNLYEENEKGYKKNKEDCQNYNIRNRDEQLKTSTKNSDQQPQGRQQTTNKAIKYAYEQYQCYYDYQQHGPVNHPYECFQHYDKNDAPCCYRNEPRSHGINHPGKLNDCSCDTYGWNDRNYSRYDAKIPFPHAYGLNEKDYENYPGDKFSRRHDFFVYDQDCIDSCRQDYRNNTYNKNQGYGEDGMDGDIVNKSLFHDDVYRKDMQHPRHASKHLLDLKQKIYAEKKRSSEDIVELATFPGPLSLNDTKKDDVIEYIERKTKNCSRDRKLIWNYLKMMIELNGDVDANHIAVFLIDNSDKQFKPLYYPGQHEAKICSVEQNKKEHLEADQSNSAESPALAKLRQLCLDGKFKEATCVASKSGLWTDAILLSRSDPCTLEEVLCQYFKSMAVNNPLRTFSDMYRGKIPVSARHLKVDEWGDWAPHLAMILSTSSCSSSHRVKSIITLGDTLLRQGLVEAAHFCYVVASERPGNYPNVSSKLVLVGSDHKKSFEEFGTIEAIQMTEIFEYCLSLAHNTWVCFPSLQKFKSFKACRLLECGYVEKAFKYFKTASENIVASPSSFSAHYINFLSSQIQNHFYELGIEAESVLEPDWFKELKRTRYRFDC